MSHYATKFFKCSDCIIMSFFLYLKALSKVTSLIVFSLLCSIVMIKKWEDKPPFSFIRMAYLHLKVLKIVQILCYQIRFQILKVVLVV